MLVELPDKPDIERLTRLWATLSDMGLYVAPIRDPDDIEPPHGLVALVVALKKPEVPLEITTGDIRSPMEGTEVGEDSPSALRDGDNVVDFPPIL